MIAPLTRQRLLGMVLALIAVFGVSAIAGWHASDFHDDLVSGQGSFLNAATPPASNAPDAAIHVAAHAFGAGLVLPARLAAFLPVALALVVIWLPLVSIAPRGLGPSSLLRPPRD